MPELLTCAKVLALAWSISGWIGVACFIRWRDQDLGPFDGWGATLGTPLFIGLMGWLS